MVLALFGLLLGRVRERRPRGSVVAAPARVRARRRRLGWPHPAGCRAASRRAPRPDHTPRSTGWSTTTSLTADPEPAAVANQPNATPASGRSPGGRAIEPSPTAVGSPTAHPHHPPITGGWHRGSFTPSTRAAASPEWTTRASANRPARRHDWMKDLQGNAQVGRTQLPPFARSRWNVLTCRAGGLGAATSPRDPSMSTRGARVPDGCRATRRRST